MYQGYFKSIGVILDQDKRKEFIIKEINKISDKHNLQVEINESLLNEITNIVEKPKAILCEFDKKFLSIPKEILIITMQNHQKYIPTFDKKKINQFFLVVSDSKDVKGYVKTGIKELLRQD